MANLLSGISPDNIDEVTEHFFYECFGKLARGVKGDEYAKMKEFLTNFNIESLKKVNINDKDVRFIIFLIYF